VATDEERIRELVEKITAANGTHQIIELARELHDLLEDRRQRLEGNLSAERESP
jgi:hypothetical protein